MPGRSLFPPAALEDARVLADTIARSNAGQPMRRIDIFDILGRSAESGSGRNLVTASSGFGLTTGGYQAEVLSLTELGRRLAVEGDEAAAIDAVLNVDIFKRFFETYANSQVPSDVAARSFLANEGVPAERTQACLDLILQNGRQSGLIDQRSGADYVLSRSHAVEARPRYGQAPTVAVQSQGSNGSSLVSRRHPPNEIPVRITLQLQLPADQAPEVYDAILASVRKRLVDGITDTD